MALVGAQSRYFLLCWSFVVALLVLGCGSENDGDNAGPFRLTVLHNNDGESRLLNAGHGMEDFGGVARFVAQVDKLRLRALTSDIPKCPFPGQRTLPFSLLVYFPMPRIELPMC